MVLAVNTSAAASTPVYFSLTGFAAAAVTASKYPRTAAHVFSPYLTKYGWDHRVERPPGVFGDVRHVPLVKGDVVARPEPAHWPPM